MKQLCNRCGTDKPEDFMPSKPHICRACHTTWSREHYQRPEVREQINARRAERRQDPAFREKEAARLREFRVRKREGGVNGRGPTAAHGTHHMYTYHACRCDACRSANAAAGREWRRRQREARAS